MWLISHISLNILGLGKFVGHLNNSPIDQPNGKKLNEASEREEEVEGKRHFYAKSVQ